MGKERVKANHYIRRVVIQKAFDSVAGHWQQQTRKNLLKHQGVGQTIKGSPGDTSQAHHVRPPTRETIQGPEVKRLQTITKSDFCAAPVTLLQCIPDSQCGCMMPRASSRVQEQKAPARYDTHVNLMAR